MISDKACTSMILGKKVFLVMCITKKGNNFTVLFAIRSKHT